jgi:hypothetical protein
MNQSRTEKQDKDFESHSHMKYSPLVIVTIAACMCWGNDKAGEETHVVTEVERNPLRH